MAEPVPNATPKVVVSNLLPPAGNLVQVIPPSVERVTEPQVDTARALVPENLISSNLQSALPPAALIPGTFVQVWPASSVRINEFDMSPTAKPVVALVKVTLIRVQV